MFRFSRVPFRTSASNSNHFFFLGFLVRRFVGPHLIQWKAPANASPSINFQPIAYTGTLNGQGPQPMLRIPCQWLIISSSRKLHAKLIMTLVCLRQDSAYLGMDSSAATGWVPDTVSQSPYLVLLRATAKGRIFGRTIGNEHGDSMSRLPAPGLQGPQLIIQPLAGVVLPEPRV